MSQNEAQVSKTESDQDIRKSSDATKVDPSAIYDVPKADNALNP